MEINERILELVKERGPILPVQISKEINDNILMTSARLSELLSNKQIKISYVKIGGSPLYYVQGQESKLQAYANNLVAKEKEAYELLKQNKILRDSIQEPAIRVALRQIKDFAVPLQVTFENTNEIFWKWYLTDNKEVEFILKGILSKKEKYIKIPEREEETKTSELKQSITTLEKPKEEIKKEKKKIDKDYFLKEINNFFNKNKINIIETNEIKKNSEIDFITELQTTIGNVKYFCKSKNKKKINESDLSTALVQAQSKGLPLLFLTTGKITKKAKEMLNTNFKNIIYREV